MVLSMWEASMTYYSQNQLVGLNEDNMVWWGATRGIGSRACMGNQKL